MFAIKECFFMNLKDNLSILNSFFQIFMIGLAKK